MNIEVADESVIYKAIIDTTIEAGVVKFEFDFMPIINLEVEGATS